MSSDAILHLRAAGVSLVLDARSGRLPDVVHWGPALPDLSADALRGLCDAVVPVVGSNNPDAPPRRAILAEPRDGWTGRPGIAGSHAGVGWSPRLEVGAATLDDAPVQGVVSTGAGRASFEARDARLRVRLDVELLPTGLVRLRAAVHNDADAPYAVDDVSLALSIPAEATELLDFTGQHNGERMPQRTVLSGGIHLRENRRGRTGADSAFVLHAGVPGFGFESGRVWAVHTAWSGNHRHFAERVFTGEQVLGGGELLLPGEVVLERGEEYVTPWVYGAHGDGLDAVAHRFHAHLRSGPRAPSAQRPVTLNVWEAVYFRHDADELIALAERAADLGVERYVLDDGWFGARRHDRAGLGDWTVSADVWPDGLHPLVDRVHALGMQFGLWFEPEMVNLDSDLARAHPEWIMAAREDLPVESRFQQVLNLSHPGAYAHVRGQLSALLDEYAIDYIKWDHNRDLIDAGDPTRGGRPVVHAQTEAFYRLLGELRDAHPSLEIESCSSGGGRVDLGVLELTDRIWVSDNSDPHDRQAMMRWSVQLAPPEYLGAHIASGHSHTTGRRMDLSFRALTALFGHLGIEWDLGDTTEAESRVLAAWIAFYKEHRSLLMAGTVVRIDGPDADVITHGVVFPDRSAAVFASSVLDTTTPEPPARLRLRGLDSARAYRVRPVLIGEVPSGLHAPQWWGEASDAAELAASEYWERGTRSDVAYPGAVFGPGVLETVGVAAPRLHPDHGVLYLIEAVD